MKTLLIMRHAKSSWDKVYLSDHERPLNKRGKRDGPRMGRLLRDLDLSPDLIITSSAKRALLTAEAVASTCDYSEEIEVSRMFYHADPTIYLERLQLLPDQYRRAMVIGHNPGIEEFVSELTGKWERMPTAAVAEVEFHIEKWAELSLESEADLVNVWRPKEIQK